MTQHYDLLLDIAAVNWGIKYFELQLIKKSTILRYNTHTPLTGEHDDCVLMYYLGRFAWITKIFHSLFAKLSFHSDCVGSKATTTLVLSQWHNRSTKVHFHVLFQYYRTKLQLPVISIVCVDVGSQENYVERLVY